MSETPPKTDLSKFAEKNPLIALRRSIIPACDVPNLDMFEKLVRETADIEGVGAYKVGARLAVRFGLENVVNIARRHTKLPIIYDHQKAGNDIPTFGEELIGAVVESKADAIILFPFSSPVTQEKWTRAGQETGITVLVGGHMTHEKFLESEGGYIADSAPERIYRLGAEMGVRDFVVPGNKVDYVNKYRALLESILGEGSFTLYAPGFLAQGGEISEMGQAAGDNWHAIVGRGIYEAENMREAAILSASKLAA